jgi:hypothetical protein
MCGNTKFKDTHQLVIFANEFQKCLHTCFPFGPCLAFILITASKSGEQIMGGKKGEEISQKLLL